MRISIVSDTHFGDPMCTLVKLDNSNGLVRGEKYGNFKEKVGTNNDYLILLGDIIDLSISSYAAAYRVAKAFFNFIKDDGIAKNIIYVPGNHDFDIWHTVEHQINVIHQVSIGNPPREFRHSAAGFIDCRTTSTKPGFQLPGIIDDVIDPNQPPEIPIYLNNITKNDQGGGEPTTFYFAYPNIYLVTDNESVLITHGHYLEAYWALVCEWVMKIAQDDLAIGDALDIRELVAINFPLNQLACSGIGQAGPLTKIVQKVQREVKDQELARVEKYVNRLDNEIDKLTPSGFWSPSTWSREAITDLISNTLKEKLIEALKESKETRYSEEFASNKEVLDRFRTYFNASWAEICQLNETYNLNIPMPNKVIFGHTHRPIKWGATDAPKAMTVGGNPVRLYNTGGWLWRQSKDGEREFCGADIFTYSEQKLSSQRVT